METETKLKPLGFELVPIVDIQKDKGTQARVEMDWKYVEELKQVLENNGAKADPAGLVSFPPVVIFRDDEGNNYLADGFHRYHAYVKIKATAVDANVFSGTLRDAILYSVGANARHGKRRSNEDKRNAVERLLADPEWRERSSEWIAKQAFVSGTFVGEMKTHLGITPGEVKTQSGKTMKVGKIGSASTGANPVNPPVVTPQVSAVAEMPAIKGRPIPPQSSAAFQVYKPQFDDLLSKLRSDKKELVNILDKIVVGGDLTVMRINGYRKQIMEFIDGAMRLIGNEINPFSVCPYCKGTDATCPACKGSGWVSADQDKSAPESLKNSELTAVDTGYWLQLKEKELAEETAKAAKEKEKADKLKEKESAKKTPKPAKENGLPNAAPKPGKKAKHKYDPAKDDLQVKTNGVAATESQPVDAQVTNNTPKDLPINTTASDILNDDSLPF